MSDTAAGDLLETRALCSAHGTSSSSGSRNTLDTDVAITVLASIASHFVSDGRRLAPFFRAVRPEDFVVAVRSPLFQSNVRDH